MYIILLNTTVPEDSLDLVSQIPASSITGSSIHATSTCLYSNARLYTSVSGGAWCAKSPSIDEWLQV